MVHQPSYDKLPSDLKSAVDKAYAEAGNYSFTVMGAAADESLARMKSKGVTFG
jgi:TRAP-type C4-dicarboxylate transport system substrate-binding protein